LDHKKHNSGNPESQQTPVGQHRAVEIDPLAAMDFGLAVERELNFSCRNCAYIRFSRARACSARVKPDVQIDACRLGGRPRSLRKRLRAPR